MKRIKLLNIKNSIDMKKILLSIIGIIASLSMFAQNPNAFSYQAVAHASNGDLITEQAVSFRISILQGSTSGTSVYSETHAATTNKYGLVTLQIGNGSTGDDFTAINWANGPYFVKVEMDATGGTTYAEMGTSQLLSVPYALHAETAQRVKNLPDESDPVYASSITAGISENDTANWNSKLNSYTESDPVFNSWSKDYNDLNNRPSISDTINTYVDGTATKITAGMNITVEGSGATDSPYVIAAAGSSASGHFVGELFGGGIVFWVNPDGQHGLVASLDDLDDGTGVLWTNVNDALIGETAQSMTDGKSNTLAIIGQDGHTNSAAKLCADYRGCEFDDWYLPSNRELSLLFSHDFTVDFILDNDSDPSTNGLTQEHFPITSRKYWSSTEQETVAAYALEVRFITYGNYTYKSSNCKVRAIRSF
jgi:hypothetical protein